MLPLSFCARYTNRKGLKEQIKSRIFFYDFFFSPGTARVVKSEFISNHLVPLHSLCVYKCHHCLLQLFPKLLSPRENFLMLLQCYCQRKKSRRKHRRKMCHFLVWSKAEGKCSHGSQRNIISWVAEYKRSENTHTAQDTLCLLFSRMWCALCVQYTSRVI